MKNQFTPPHLIENKMQYVYKIWFAFIFLFLFVKTDAQSIQGDTSVCINNYRTYTFPAQAGYRYQWQVTGGSWVQQNSNPGSPYTSNGIDSVDIIWTTNVQGIITLLEINHATGQSTVHTYNVTLHGLPEPFVTSSFSAGCLRSKVEGQYEAYNGSSRLQSLSYAANQEISCFVVCEESQVIFTANVQAGSTFEWQLEGNYSSFTEQGNDIIINFDEIGSASLILREVNQYGCVQTVSYCIEIVEKPEAEILINHIDAVGNTLETCSYQSVFFSANTVSNDYSLKYTWFINGVWANNTPNLSHDFNVAGNYEIMLVVTNECNCTDTAYAYVNVDVNSIADLDCIGVVCAFDTVTYSTSASCSPYNWTVIGGTLLSTNNNSLTVVWDNVPTTGYGQIILNGASCTGICPLNSVFNIPILTPTTNIQGSTLVCSNGFNQTYTVPFWAGSLYNWSVTNIQSQQNPVPFVQIANGTSHQVNINYGNFIGSFTLEVEYQNQAAECEGSASLNIEVKNDMQLAGPIKVCAFTNNTWKAVPDLQSGYVWTLDGNILSETSATLVYEFTQAGSYILHVSHPDFYNEQEVVVVVSDVPPSPSNIVGADSVCTNVFEAYSATPSNPNFFLIWEIFDNNGNSVYNNEGTSINYAFANASVMPYRVTVRQANIDNNACQSAPVEKWVYLKAPPTLEILGEDTVCANYINNYSTNFSNAQNFNWTLSPNSLGSVSTNGLPSAEIQWNNVSPVPQNASLQVTADYCSAVLSASKQITITNSPPPIINLPDSICVNDLVQFSVTNIASGIFEWSFSPQPTTLFGENTSQVSARFGSAGTHTVMLTVTNPNGCLGQTVSASETFYVNPLPVATISVDSGEVDYYVCHYIDSTVNDIYVRFVRTSQALTGHTYTWQLNENDVAGTENEDFFELTSSNFPAPINQVGSVSVRIRVVNDTTGCSNFSNYFLVRILPCEDTCIAVPIEIVQDVNRACNSIDFSAQVIQPQDQVGELYWNVNYPSNNPDYQYVGNNLSHTYTSSGIYTIFTRASSYGYDPITQTIDTSYTCFTDTTMQIAVPAIPNFEVSFFCNGNNQMQVEWLRTTDFVANYTTFTATIYTIIDANNNTIYQGSTPPSTLPPGDYTITLSETYNFNHPAYTVMGETCITTRTISIPEPAQAVFTYGPNPVCQGEAIQFTSQSTGDIVGWFWDYDDGTSSLLPNTSFKVYSQLPPFGFYNTSLTITDQYGCQYTASLPLVVNEDAFTVEGIIGDSIACANVGATLSVQMEEGTPSQYLWSTGETTSSITVNQTGVYSVELTDANGCRERANGKLVIIPTVPASYITGPQNVCNGDEFTLNGPVGSNLTYTWQRYYPNLNNPSLGNWYNVGGNTQTLDQTNYQSGPIDYRLIVSSTQGYVGAACPDTSTIYSVNVRQPLDYPQLQINFNCELPANISVANLSDYQSYSSMFFNWSTGASGVDNIDIFVDGAYSVTLTDTFGCQTTTQTNFSHPPALGHIPMGCAAICDTSLPVLLNTHAGVVEHWYWLRKIGNNFIQSNQQFHEGWGTIPFLYLTQTTDVGEWYLVIEGNYYGTACADTILFTTVEIESCCPQFNPTFEFSTDTVCFGDTLYLYHGLYDTIYAISVYFEYLDTVFYFTDIDNISNDSLFNSSFGLDTLMIIVGNSDASPLPGLNTYCFFMGDSTGICGSNVCIDVYGVNCCDNYNPIFEVSDTCISEFTFAFGPSTMYEIFVTHQGDTILNSGIIDTADDEDYDPNTGIVSGIGSFDGFPGDNLTVTIIMYESGNLFGCADTISIDFTRCIEPCDTPTAHVFFDKDTICNNSPVVININSDFFYYELAGESGYADVGYPLYSSTTGYFTMPLEAFTFQPNATDQIMIVLFHNNDSTSLCRDTAYASITSIACENDCDSLGLTPFLVYQIQNNQLHVYDASQSIYGYDFVNVTFNGQQQGGSPGDYFIFDLDDLNVKDTVCIQIAAFIDDICCYSDWYCVPVIINCETMGFEASANGFFNTNTQQWSLNYTGNHTPDIISWTFPDGTQLAGNVANNPSLLNPTWYDFSNNGGEICVKAVLFIPSECGQAIECCVSEYCFTPSVYNNFCEQISNELYIQFTETGIPNTYFFNTMPFDVFSNLPSNITLNDAYWTVDHDYYGYTQTDNIYQHYPVYTFNCRNEMGTYYYPTLNISYSQLNADGSYTRHWCKIGNSFYMQPCEDSSAQGRVYPNPVSDELTIDFTGVSTINTFIEIYDVLGKKMYEKQINSPIEYISTQLWSKGVYQVVFKTEETTYIQKIVKN